MGYSYKMGLLRRLGSYRTANWQVQQTSHEAFIFIPDSIRWTLQRCTRSASTVPIWMIRTTESTQETVLPRKHHGSRSLNRNSRIITLVLSSPVKLAQTRFTNHNKHPSHQDVLLVQARLRLQARDVRIREILHSSQPHSNTMQEEEYLADDQDGRGV